MIVRLSSVFGLGYRMSAVLAFDYYQVLDGLIDNAWYNSILRRSSVHLLLYYDSYLHTHKMLYPVSSLSCVLDSLNNDPQLWYNDTIYYKVM